LSHSQVNTFNVTLKAFYVATGTYGLHAPTPAHPLPTKRGIKNNFLGKVDQTTYQNIVKYVPNYFKSSARRIPNLTTLKVVCTMPYYELFYHFIFCYCRILKYESLDTYICVFIIPLTFNYFNCMCMSYNSSANKVAKRNWIIKD